MWPFSPKPQRAVFSFFDGEKTRSVDPYHAMRDFSAGINWPEDIEAYDEGDVDAIDRVTNAAHKAFGIKSYSDGGLTVAETREVIMHFLNYLVAVKKKHKEPPTSSQPTDSDGSSPENSSETES